MQDHFYAPLRTADMEEPARKRRRTNSPQEDDRNRQSSPLRKPPRRPSFASPTKASLARNYPDLLPSKSVMASAIKSRSHGVNPSNRQQAPTPVPRNTEVRPNEPDSMGGAQEQNLERTQLALNGQITSPLENRSAQEKNRKRRQQRMDGNEDEERNRPRMDGDEADEISNQDSPPRKRSPPNPELEKRRQARARLQREIADLEAQTSKCVDVISQIEQRASGAELRGQRRQDLLNFINQISEKDDVDQPSISVSNLLCSFLPFSVMPSFYPTTKQIEQAISSHKPVELTDPLPYLEMFTSLKISSKTSLTQGKPSREGLQHKHIVDMSGPQRLLRTQVSITIDAVKHEINNLQILELSIWAERELGTFIRKQATENGFGNIGWAVDSYWNIATKRARHWQKCEQAFAHLLIGHGNKDVENERQQLAKSQKMSRKELHRYLGRDMLLLQDNHVLLKLTWKIDFDWTGEAESAISAETAFPPAWTEADTTAHLKKIPSTFAELLRTRGAFEATRIMTTLLFPR